MKVSIFSVIAALACTAMPVLAWNDFGHKAIAYIAYEDLTPQAKERVNAILAKHPQHEALVGRVKKLDAELLAFMGAATWPDMLRSESNPLHATDHRSQWHYINLPLSFDGTKGPEPRFECKTGSDPENVLQAIDKCEADLRDPKLSDEDKAKRICWLMHLVGDLHQPLHAVALFRKDLPKGDRGGNLLWIGFDEKPINLHSFWDNVLGESKSAERVKEKAEALRTRKGLRREDLAKTLKADTARAWADESAVLAKSTAYLDGKLDATVAESRPATAPALPKGYVTAAEKAADERAALAGYRLADRLNRLFDPDFQQPKPIAKPKRKP